MTEDIEIAFEDISIGAWPGSSFSGTAQVVYDSDADSVHVESMALVSADGTRARPITSRDKCVATAWLFDQLEGRILDIHADEIAGIIPQYDRDREHRLTKAQLGL